MNKIKNKYYLKVAIIFSFLSCLVPLISWHLDLYISECRFIYDDKATIVYFFIFLIQSGINLLCYGLGRCFDFNIRPLIILFSFGDFVFVFFGLWFLFLLAPYGPTDLFAIFKHFDIDLYFIILFLSKFLLIYILKRIDKKISKNSQSISFDSGVHEISVNNTPSNYPTRT